MYKLVAGYVDFGPGLTQFFIVLLGAVVLVAVALTLLFTWVGKNLAFRRLAKQLRINEYDGSSWSYLATLAISGGVALLGLFSPVDVFAFLVVPILPFLYVYIGYAFAQR